VHRWAINSPLKLIPQTLPTRIREQTAASKDQAERLENIENLMSRMPKELIAIKEILALAGGANNIGESDGGA